MRYTFLPMNAVIDLEKEILALPPAERERLAMVAWESLVSDPNAASDLNIDSDGLALAVERDAELESGQVNSLNHAEFLLRTRGASE
jgi:hypothetical protein